MDTLIYLATNTLNGKVYIGQTANYLSSRKADHRRKALVHRSRSHFHAAIRKYGFDAFEWRVLERVLIREILNERERWWVVHYRSTDPARGYNNTTGGCQCEFTADVRAKIAAAMTGPGNPNYGKPKSTETKARMSAVQKGRVRSPEHCVKLSAAGKRRRASPETRLRMSLAHRGRKHSPEAMERSRLANIGQKRTPEQRARMSEAARRRRRAP